MKTLSFCVLFCAAVSLVFAQTEPPKFGTVPPSSPGLSGAKNATNERKLSLEECIEIALRHNLDVQIRRLSPDIARYTLRANYGSYDPSLSFSGEHDFNQSAGGVDAEGRPFA